MIKILVVDDHDLVRMGIRRMLEDVEGMQVLGEAASGEEAIAKTKELEPDVVLLDLKMPGIGGLEATRKLLQINDDLRILAVTSCEEEPLPSRILKTGAAGYLTKGAGLDEMVSAIRKVATGQRYISSSIAQKLALSSFQEEHENPFSGLSEREMQITIMIVNCHKVSDISDQLCLSPKTVNSYRYRIFDKLEVSSDVELTHLALRHDLVNDEQVS